MRCTRIKVCGITSVNDARQAIDCGVDALGLVFYPKSPRAVSPEQAREIARQQAPFTCLVGLFVNASPQAIEQVLKKVPLGLLQFHGDETEADCSRWQLPYIKALRVRPDRPVKDRLAPFHSACGYLLDSYCSGVAGGTGASFDWQLIPDGLDKPVILAGGLNPGNVRQAITAVQPYAVDVSTGVERSPGVKDIDKIKAFVKAAGR